MTDRSRLVDVRALRLASVDVPTLLVRYLRWLIVWLGDFVGRRGGPRLRFRCNVCGHGTSFSRAGFGRELPSCGWCASTVRVRALVEAISMAVFGGHYVAPELPVRKDLHGLGFSDQIVYARQLRRATTYTNSWYHRPPYHDLMDLASFRGETFDFIVCSEVLEHVTRPPERAIANLFALLRPGGVLIASVPMRDGHTTEHFPELTSYEVKKVDQHWELHGVRPDGSDYVGTDLVFHGGPGTTLEMRVWGRDSMRALLERAGFSDVEEFIEEREDIGVVWVGTPETMLTRGGLAVGLHAGIWIARKPANVEDDGSAARNDTVAAPDPVASQAH